MTEKNDIIIVSGLPRSGTSMMMKMLEAGGIPVLIDEIRQADVDNPKGYYEFERVKKLPEDTGWLPDAEGKVVKMVSMLLQELPKDRRYKVVFMRRRMEEILVSQKKMLERTKKDVVVDDDEMATLFDGLLTQTLAWLNEQDHLDVVFAWYHEILENPKPTVNRLNDFFENKLDTKAMINVIDEDLYRNKANA
ncbi:MAG: sulfotransferase domain-containing protein [bacterium]|nr:sulfotransferase domain-containing protein [bacterium]